MILFRIISRTLTKEPIMNLLRDLGESSELDGESGGEEVKAGGERGEWLPKVW